MPIQDPPPQPAPRHVVPWVLLLIFLGMLSPFVVTWMKRNELSSNEIAVVKSMREFYQAQDAYFEKKKAYAASFAELNSPLAAADMDAADSGQYHGYRFRLLTSQGPKSPGGAKRFIDENGRLTGGYALLAAPARFGFSGRDTFFLSGHDIYYADLGVHTEEATRNLRYFALPQSAIRVENP